MKKFMKIAPWLIAGGAIAIAVGTRKFYSNKIFLELPNIIVNGHPTAVLPGKSALIYLLKDGTQLAVSTVEAAVDVAVAAA